MAKRKDRKYFQFYREWWELLQEVDGCETRYSVIAMIIDYALDGIEPDAEEMQSLDKFGRMCWKGIYPQLKSSRVHWQSGCQSQGAPKGNNNAAKFKIPTLEEVEQYFKSKNYEGDPEEFFRYNEARGWDAEKHFKTWKDAVDRWCQMEGGKRKPPEGVTLGVDEWIDQTTGERKYGSGKVAIPMDAPPRPGRDYCWNASGKNWIVQ